MSGVFYYFPFFSR